MKATFFKLVLLTCAAAAIVASLATAAEKFSAAIADPCAKYEFFWKAEPAFLTESTLSIVADGGITRATVTYSPDRVTPTKLEQLSLNDEASHKFCAVLLRLVATPQKTDNRMVWDGISVEGSFAKVGAVPYKFSFKSPNKQETPRELGIADAVFTALENATVSCELNVYLERLSGYFQFGLPAKVVSAEPLTLRFYNGFSLNHYMDVHTLLEKLSKSQSARIDVSNFDGMGTMYYDDFRRLISEVPLNTGVGSSISTFKNPPFPSPNCL